MASGKRGIECAPPAIVTASRNWKEFAGSCTLVRFGTSMIHSEEEGDHYRW